MNCRIFSKRMSEYVDGRLDEPVRAEFEAHRLDCPACASELDSTRKLEEEARRATELRPLPGFEGLVLERLEAGEGIREPAARPGPRAFRFPYGLAAGILLGIALGFGIHASFPGPAEQDAEMPETAPRPPVEAKQIEPVFISKDLTEAKRDLENFVDASELLASDITTLPLADDPSYSWITLGKILDAMDYEQKMEKARRARPVLEHFEPECAPLLDSYIEEQADIRNLIGSASISPGAVKDVQARALTTMDNVYQVRRRFGLWKRHETPRILEADIDSVSVELRLDGEDEYIAQASKRELDDDFRVALALCQNLMKKYPRSRLKPLAFTREARIWNKNGRNDRIVRMFENMPKVFRTGEIDQGFLVVVGPLLKNMGECDPRKKNRILGQIVGRFGQRWTPFTVIQSLRLDDTPVPVLGESPQKAAFTLYALLPKNGWNSALHVSHSKGQERKTVLARFTKGKDLGEEPRRILEDLVRSLSAPPDLDAVETIEFEGR